MRPLDGVLVVAVEQAVAGPLATRHLADLGARVLKVERPDGGDFARDYDTTVEGLSSYFVWANRSKESVALDLKDEADRDVLEHLLRRADVFLQNLAPDGAGRLGIDGASVRARHPHLVVCEISGYGTDGPLRASKAYDLLIQAEAAVLELTGTPGQPAKVGISVADIAAAMYAYSGILAGLHQRHRTGEGNLVQVSMLEALAEWASPQLYYDHYGDRPLGRSGARHATIAPYGPFPTADGTIVVGVQNDREWQRFCTLVLERPVLAGDPRFASNVDRVDNVEELEAIIGTVLGTLAAADAVRRLDDAGIAHARMNDLTALWDHPQLAARDRFATIDGPTGPLTVLRPPAEPEAGAALGPVPALGQHTAAVLEELGLSPTTRA